MVRRQLSEVGIVVPDHVLARNAMMSAIVRVIVAYVARVRCLRSVVVGLLTRATRFRPRVSAFVAGQDIPRHRPDGHSGDPRSGGGVSVRRPDTTHASRVHYKNQTARQFENCRAARRWPYVVSSRLRAACNQQSEVRSREVERDIVERRAIHVRQD